jgi:hypothetical protein
MEGFFNKFINNFSNIEGILINVLGMLIGTALVGIGSLIIRKIFKPKPPEVAPTASGEQAFYLNKPKNLLKDICVERDSLLKKVFNAIKDENSVPFVGNHVAIIGREGIGKTLFCQYLYNNFLRYSKIFLGWIECEGVKSIYDIINEDFTDSRFKMKNKDKLLKMIEDLDRPCVLFVDQVDQHTSLDEIKELITCPNTSVVVSGLLKKEKIKFIDEKSLFSLERLSNNTTRRLFEDKAEAGKEIEDMESEEKHAAKFIIDAYIMGNPFLVAAYAGAKALNGNSWVKVKENMGKSEYDDESDDYIKNQLKKLYKIYDLDDDEKKTLSKLCVFSSMQYTEAVFEFGNIPMECVNRLCRTYWLTQSNVFYYLDEVHKKVLEKVLRYSDNLRELITSLTSYLSTWDVHENKGFEQIAPYAEDILNKVKAYTPRFMDDPDLFANFAYLVADKYHFAIENHEKSREWLGYCNPTGIILPEYRVFLLYKEYKKLQKKDMEASDSPGDIFELPRSSPETPATYDDIKRELLKSRKKKDISKLQLEMLYKKDVLDFHLKMSLLNSSVKPSEVEQAYSSALSTAKKFDDFGKRQKFLKEEYCVFLVSVKRYNEVKSLCKEHFDISGFSLDDRYSCALYYRYLSAAYASDDEELIESLIHKEILDALWNNSEVSIAAAWSFGALYYIFNEKGNDEIAELCKRRMVILINRKTNFWHSDIKRYIALSDEEFIEYMHSHDELAASLKEAIDREDAEALYLEGRYKEKNGDFNKAFDLYEKSATKDNLKGICSLALMYYRGPEYYKGLEEPQNFAKAREYWEYCNEGERKHRGSHYWLGIMLNDEKYEGYDKELAIQHFIKAAEMGNKGAIKKLLELGVLSASESKGEQL